VSKDNHFNKSETVAYFPLVQEAMQALNSLSPVERGILNMRFGLDDGEERSREEVAKHYGVSAEIIRLVEVEALRKLRSPASYCQKERVKRKASHLHLVQ
jgi:RNA polymerase primary sigma factor